MQVIKIVRSFKLKVFFTFKKSRGDVSINL